ncbi:MarR family winged helix-turn-helix transcriptional regulator [Streptomyces sp. NPDC002742]|jgi:DNA-binding MarR family transcriptional regulator|uniref:MarR family winged helix-turn-helix transcriptional regulator n=1 Tax=unclassified Streptomyces TaxID=2593676 RepID=UPI00343F8FA0
MSRGLDAALRLMRAQAALVKRFDASLGGLHGVSLADFTTLLRLSEAPGDRMRRVDLAEALGLTASGVTRGLVPLERIGLVRRDADARDARVAYATLTETGRERLADMLVTAEQVAEDIFAEPPWTKEEAAQLAGLLGRLGGTGFTRREPGGS